MLEVIIKWCGGYTQAELSAKSAHIEDLMIQRHKLTTEVEEKNKALRRHEDKQRAAVRLVELSAIKTQEIAGGTHD